ncbi:MAG: hypothetical protein CL910_05475 [Deltaproteobacteria bacterium]|nr:hypothetical protein [Deltaproteobacteria bacterium]
MRRLLLAIAVVLALGLAAVAIVLPRVAERPELRARLTEAAREATGRELQYEKLGVGLFPPRLEVTGAALVGAPGEDPVGADRIALRISWLPLLARQLVIRSIEVDAPRLTVLRTSEGIALPFSPPEEPERDEAPRDPAPEDVGEEDQGFELLVQSVRLRDAAITLDDRTAQPPSQLRVERVDATIDVEALPASISAELSGFVADAPVRLEGQRSQGGDLDARIEIDGLALQSLQPWIGDEDFAGSLVLDVRAKAHREQVERLELRAVLKEALIEAGDLVVRGDLPLTAELSGAVDALGGPFRLELADATILVEESFAKPPGVPARLAGTLVQGAEGRRIDALELQLHNLAATGRALLGSATTIELDAEPFSLEGWAPLVPALGDPAPAGRLALDGLKVGLGPVTVHGGLVVEELVLPLESGASATLSGRLQGTGDALEGEGLDLRIAEQPFDLALGISRLAEDPRLRLRLDADGADSQKLLAALAGREDTLSGPLRLRSDLRGPLTGEGALVERLRGKLRFDIKPGRLKGVSLLRSTFDGMGKGGDAAVAAGKLSKDEKVQRFYEDEFERLGGTLALRGGKAKTDDLRLDYRHYRVDLRGSVGLVDRSLDLTGKLTIFEEIDEALRPGSEGEERRDPRSRVIPLAEVGGTIDEPKVTVTSDAALRLGAAAYATEKRRKKWERKLDERLGEGAGKDVLGILDAILSGEAASGSEDPDSEDPDSEGPP